MLKAAPSEADRGATPQEPAVKPIGSRSPLTLAWAVLRKLLSLPGALLALVMILLVRFYQVCISPLLPPVCRFQPSCSHYFILAVRKYGAVRGGWKGVCRICRCHPWSPGGFDPP